MSNQGIMYALIANVNGDIISEVSRVKGSHAMNAKKVLQSIPRNSTDRRCIAHDHLYYSILGDGSLVFLCVTEESFSRVTTFSFLNAIKESCGGGRKNNASEMHQQLKRDIEYYSDPKNDKISKIRTDINEVKNVMIDNIDKILERGDQIENLVSKTENLDFDARRFESNARDLKWKMWKKRMILTGILLLIILIVVFCITLFACSKDGVNFDKCRSSNNTSST